MKSALSVLLLCFLSSSCREKKAVENDKTVDTKKVVEDEKTIQERPKESDIDGKAQYELAKKYESGEEVPLEFAEAAKWRRKAAEQGHADAQVSLGMMYDIGLGVPKNYAEAAKWFRKAAEQGNINAKEWLKQNAKEDN